MASKDKKRGLGRGLSALMSDVAPVNEAGQSVESQSASTLPIEMVVANPDQPRKRFTEEDLSDLTASIKEKGIIQPLVVRKVEDAEYQIVAGERRWRAAQRANLHEVPVVVREFTDLEVIEIAIIENIQRSDLNPIEEAAGYRQLMDKFGHTQEKLSEALGKSRSHIANLLRLLTLPEDVTRLVQEGQLSAGHARALITATDPSGLAKRIVKEGLSVRATEALAKQVGNQNKPSGKGSARVGGGAEKDADTRALEGDLSAALGMKVSLDHGKDGESGSITIKYKTLEELDALCGRLGGA